MNSNFYGKHKPLVVAMFCFTLLWGSNPTYASDGMAAVRSTQQAAQVRGTIVDAAGEPVIGASVLEKGTTNGTITNLDGNFTLSGTVGTELVISYIGYITQTVKITPNMKITLHEDTQTLDEVVVVGYGTMKKSDLTGSVGSVSSEKLAARGSVSVEAALQGAVPGVDISQSNSRAGGGFKMQIRGQASINREVSPLYVIDGVVSESMDFLNPEDIERVDILKDASSTAIYGSRASAGVVMITTKGSKGAGKSQKVSVGYDGYYGVRKLTRLPDWMNADQYIDYRLARFTTLETTKYPGSNYPGVDAQGVPHYTITTGNLETAFMKRSGGADYRDSHVYEMLMAGESYDWKDLVTQTGTQQNHFISINGAGEKSSFRLGVGYQGEENVFKYNDYSRFNLKGAFDGKISKVFEAGFSINAAYSVKEDFQTNATYSPYETAFKFNPFIAPYDADGNVIVKPADGPAFGSPSGFSSTVSPLTDLVDKNYTDETRKYTILSNFYLRANIMEGLKATTTFSPNFMYSRHGVFNGTGLNDRNTVGSSYYIKNNRNSAEVTTAQRLSWTWDNQIDYAKTIGDHTFSGMGLFSMYRSDREEYYMKGFDFPDDKLSYNALDKAASIDKTIKSDFTQSMLVSAAFRGNYSYKDRYLATVTVRTDGSSRFSKGNRWGWFPSAALAWRASEEDFAKDIQWLDNLKLRLSYGVTGNNNVDDYVTHSTVGGPNKFALDGQEVQAYYPNGLVNPNLIWEKVKEFDFGFDLGVWDGRVSVTADFYNRLSDGQIMNRAVPMETGESTTTFNVGSVRNRGIELGVQYNVIRNNDFSWSVNANFSRNWNKILELSQGKVDETTSNRFIGQPLNVLRDYTHTAVITDKGVTMKTKDGNIHYTLQELFDRYGSSYRWYEGQMAVNDWNNDGKITDEDKQIYGCTDPKWIGSFTSTMNYRGFDFSFMLYTKQGQWSRSYFHDAYMNYGDRGLQKMQLDFYIPKGTDVFDHATGDIVKTTETHYGKYPYPNFSDVSAGGYFSTNGSAKGEGFQYQKTSFVKVKNITLGYTFPKPWIAKAGMQHLRLYLNVINPFTFTNYEGFDPEWAGATLTNGGPASITYQMGASIKF